MTKRITVVAAALAVTFATLPAAAEPDEAPHERRCPAFLRGTRLLLAENPAGAALTITTSRAQHLPELRAMVREAAIFVEAKAGQVLDPDEPAARIPPLTVAVTNVASGSRVVLRVKRAADLPLLHIQVRLLDSLWKDSECINGPRLARGAKSV